jgi:hypothetical protein
VFFKLVFLSLFTKLLKMTFSEEHLFASGGWAGNFKKFPPRPPFKLFYLRVLSFLKIASRLMLHYLSRTIFENRGSLSWPPTKGSLFATSNTIKNGLDRDKKGSRGEPLAGGAGGWNPACPSETPRRVAKGYPVVK